MKNGTLFFCFVMLILGNLYQQYRVEQAESRTKVALKLVDDMKERADKNYISLEKCTKDLDAGIDALTKANATMDACNAGLESANRTLNDAYDSLRLANRSLNVAVQRLRAQQ